jgi:hypothetical protein
MVTETYPCFLSYRHTGDPNAAQYVQEFQRQLQKHLATRIADCKVYLDDKYLKSGFIDRELATALCKSACLVIYYSRFHFDHHNPYCAREYHAMLELEKKRRELLPYLQGKSLIMTAARRDFDRIPTELTERVCYRFEEVLCKDDFRQRRKCQERFDQLASTIADHYTELLRAGLLAQCQDFDLPQVSSFQPWLDSTSCTSTRMPMPGY